MIFFADSGLLECAAEVRHQPESLFNRATVAVNKVPRNIGNELALLDSNEVSVNLTQDDGKTLVFLMLCSRTNALTAGNREEVRNALFVQRIEAFAAGYLQELRGDAIIKTP